MGTIETRWGMIHAHPLSCSIWKGAVCDCCAPSPLKYEGNLPGMYVQPSAATVGSDHNLDHDYGDDDVEASDTDRPPAEHAKKCYWCGSKWELDVYHGIPSCADCKRRAVGRRSK